MPVGFSGPLDDTFWLTLAICTPRLQYHEDVGFQTQTVFLQLPSGTMFLNRIAESYFWVGKRMLRQC